MAFEASDSFVALGDCIRFALAASWELCLLISDNWSPKVNCRWRSVMITKMRHEAEYLI